MLGSKVHTKVSKIKILYSFTIAAQAYTGGNLVSLWRWLDIKSVLWPDEHPIVCEFSISLVQINPYIKCFLLFLPTDTCKCLIKYCLYGAWRRGEPWSFLSFVSPPSSNDYHPALLKVGLTLSPEGKSTSTLNPLNKPEQHRKRASDFIGKGKELCRHEHPSPPATSFKAILPP